MKLAMLYFREYYSDQIPRVIYNERQNLVRAYFVQTMLTTDVINIKWLRQKGGGEYLHASCSIVRNQPTISLEYICFRLAKLFLLPFMLNRSLGLLHPKAPLIGLATRSYLVTPPGKVHWTLSTTKQQLNLHSGIQNWPRVETVLQSSATVVIVKLF